MAQRLADSNAQADTREQKQLRPASSRNAAAAYPNTAAQAPDKYATAAAAQLNPAHGKDVDLLKNAAATPEMAAASKVASQATSASGALQQGKIPQATQAGPGYVNGHHGLPQLEHALSASSAAMALNPQLKQAEPPARSTLAISSSAAIPASKQPAVAAPASTSKPGTAATPAAAKVREVQQHGAAPSPSIAPSSSSNAGGHTAAASSPAQQAVKLASPSLKASSEAACRGCGKAEFSGRTVTALGRRWHRDCWRCAACSLVLEGQFNTGPLDNLPYHPACYQEKFGKQCTACNKALVGAYSTVNGQALHKECFKCAACQGVIGDKYNTHKDLKTHFHPQCYKERFGVRCIVCSKLDPDITVKSQPMHKQCFTCAACSKVINGSYRSHAASAAHYHPDCYQEKFGARCTVCNKVFKDKYAVIDGRSMHHECFTCAACQKEIQGKYSTDKDKQMHYHPDCFEDRFGARCAACSKVLKVKYTIVEGKNMHYECFKCTSCQGQISGKYSSDKEKQAHYHPNCYQEKFGARCSACNKVLVGNYTVVGGKDFHHECFKCTHCHLPIGDSKYQTHGDDKLPYHLACYRQTFDPHCDVCGDLVPLQVSLHAAL